MRARTSRPAATPALLDPPSPAAAVRPPGERNQDPLPAGDPPRHVINATSVLVHPGLGRAVLSGSARHAVAVASGCTDLEYDLHNGQRGRRGRETVAALLAAVPTAAAAYVVNSNPAALVLAATVLAPGRELVISRRELYEIRDGFRLPELLTSTGARLCPVGTADGAVLEDYRQAVWSGTGCVLTLVPGRSATDAPPDRPDVAALAGLHVPVIADISSGLLRPEPALPGEPDAETALRQGATLVTAGGDKLLGGPQTGLLLGDRAVIEQVRRHPLARAMQADKLALAALRATVVHGGTPTLAAVRAAPDDLRARGESLVGALRAGGVAAELVESHVTVLSGASTRLHSFAVAIDQRLAGRLRVGDPAVVGELRDGHLLLDLRSVPAGNDTDLVVAVLAAASRP
ncbi:MULTISPECIES: L-seryl-tRNA selenium transferase [unclassified Micromonospora]|uniref:aminotransferase class V-fold PLP-dependent enzyme n=1 Tax=unclassified Micromonospora TaxID=2617518 RepID=UPI001C222842|nr:MULTISPECIES: L-seryl-tRNA selenium transferase [unclassified Micromonospora]MBU8860298.1 L-seryl-tRNA selenium transferase [Micromonospora sp. WMMB482]MDM4779832.1 L-seryl-tRNA selenium transferase [Micromonospora sp. b486]